MSNMESLYLSFCSGIIVAVIMSFTILKIIRLLIERNRILIYQFTQDLIDKRYNDIISKLSILARRDINLIDISYIDNYLDMLFYGEDIKDTKEDEIQFALSLINYFNILINGILNDIYDEKVIKINYRKEMLFLNKYFRKLNIYGYEDILMQIEYINRQWERNKRVK